MNAAEFKLLIADPQTSLGYIEALGWSIETDEHTTRFRHPFSEDVVLVPRWVLESISRACAQTHRETQREIREAIGL